MLSRDSQLLQRTDHTRAVTVFDRRLDSLIEFGDASEGHMCQLICLQVMPDDLDVV